MAKNLQKQIISRIPTKGMSGEEWGFAVEHELVQLWQEAMTENERKLWSAACAQRRIETLPKSIFTKLDLIIVNQAKTLGWRIALSPLVQFRLSEWDCVPQGP